MLGPGMRLCAARYDGRAKTKHSLPITRYQFIATRATAVVQDVPTSSGRVVNVWSEPRARQSSSQPCGANT